MGFGKDGKGAILREQSSQALGALAANTGILMAGMTLTEDFRLLKSEITALIVGLTAAESTGLQLYLVQQALTLAQAEACIEANGPSGREDRPGEEQAERFVRLIGIANDDGGGDSNVQMIGGDDGDQGVIMRIKPRWTFPNVDSAVSWNWMIYNHGVVITTGSTMKLLATHYGVWLL